MNDETGATAPGDAADESPPGGAGSSPGGMAADCPEAGRGEGAGGDAAPAEGTRDEVALAFAPSEGGGSPGLILLLFAALFWNLVIILAVLEKVKISLLE